MRDRKGRLVAKFDFLSMVCYHITRLILGGAFLKKFCLFLSFILLLSFSACSDNPEQKKLTCTLEIRCDEALSSDLLDDGKRELLPSNGAIIEKCEVPFSEGESALDALLREVSARKIHIDFSKTPGFGSSYIEGVANLYELDCGPASGWLYYVNGQSPDVGYSEYTLCDGDYILLSYTCDWTALYRE